MKINLTKFYTFVFVIVIFLQLYLPSFRANIVIQCFLIIVLAILDRKLLTVGILKVIFPLLLLLGLGLSMSLFGDNYEAIHIIKDITHFIKPISGILLGYFIFKNLALKDFVKICVLTALLCALIHFFLIISGGISIASVSDIRNSGKDNFIELFGLLFGLFYPRFCKEQLFRSSFLRRLILGIIMLSTILYFSRTMIIVFLLSLLTIYGFTRINKANIRVLLVLVGMVVLLYAYLFTIKLNRDNGYESFLYKIKVAPSELFQTKIDRENHKDLWDHWRGYEAKRALALMEQNPMSYIVGTGFGSLIDLRFKAPLDEKGMRYISETHNGYIYIFYKTGLVGFLLLLYFLAKIYNYLYRKSIFVNIFISAIGIVFFFTTLTITGIYNPKDVIIIMLGGLLSFSHLNTAKE